MIKLRGKTKNQYNKNLPYEILTTHINQLQSIFYHR